MKVLLLLIVSLYGAKLTQTVTDGTQTSFANQIADLLLVLNYDSNFKTKRNHPVTRPTNRQSLIYRKFLSQRGARSNKYKLALIQRRKTINSLVDRRISLKRNRVEKNKIISSMFLV